jgi:hypothetical protein
MASGRRQFLLLVSDIRLDDIRDALERGGGGGGARGQDDCASDISRPRALIDLARYDTIPRIWRGAESHPRRTNLLCWHCALAFSRVPRFIAIESSRRETRAGVIVHDWVIDGNFCSWACAAAYIDDNYRDAKKFTLAQNLASARAQIDGGRVRMVRRAPARIAMQSYVGADGITQQAFADATEDLSRAIV